MNPALVISIVSLFLTFSGVLMLMTLITNNRTISKREYQANKDQIININNRIDIYDNTRRWHSDSLGELNRQIKVLNELHKKQLDAKKKQAAKPKPPLKKRKS